MADLPILFSAPMVRALLREIENPGTGKTQTRRIVKPQPTASGTVTLGDRVIEASEWQIREGKFIRINEGDRLYVREAWRVSRMHDQVAPRDLKPRTMTVFFEAGGSIANQDAPGDWKPAVWPEIGERPDWAGKFRQAMHMPRWASRITLEVTGVKVERLQDCSREDAIAEGIEQSCPEVDPWLWKDYGSELDFDDPVLSYASLWDSINGPGAWEANPWVAAYIFRPILGNIDQIARAA
ncbi:hypothetical protein IPU75_01180 [Ochrobactrum sp. SD129]|uniref:Uncharacterized protein n=1 Tax=Brucella intermedia M86 TaxID=1234597 RepID=M5JJJ3_9HYPH|nr:MULTISPECIES: hypothetical protein [Brucella]ELT46298.1 hypothetical protein D584_25494 [Brucella intermedia M86]MBO1023323.1 hypothetical protein [Ochrobactrum sp. SD129]WKT94491.1 hypothetical protein QYR01_24130 [Brucella anthropi]